VAFYNPDATVIREGESTLIFTAKVYFNDRNEVFIFSFDAPPEIWTNYNKEYKTKPGTVSIHYTLHSPLYLANFSSKMKNPGGIF
jgi:hypothetical protein